MLQQNLCTHRIYLYQRNKQTIIQGRTLEAFLPRTRSLSVSTTTKSTRRRNCVSRRHSDRRLVRSMNVIRWSATIALVRKKPSTTSSSDARATS